MNDDIQLLYNIKDGGSISPNECEKINKALSKISIDNIPKNQLENVRTYLLKALEMHSVNRDIIKELNNLSEYLNKKNIN